MGKEVSIKFLSQETCVIEKKNIFKILNTKKNFPSETMIYKICNDFQIVGKIFLSEKFSLSAI